MPDNLPVISRPRDGAMLGGVCAGLARRWQVDPALLRISIVVLAFFGGLGLAAYGAGLLLMPRDGQAEMPIRRILPFTRAWSTAAVVAATVGALAVVVGITSSGGVGLGPVVVIFAIWFFGFRNHGTRRAANPPEPTPFERSAEAWRQRLAEQHTPGYEALPVAAPAEQRWTQPYTDPAGDLAVRDNEPPAVLADRRRRRHFWWLALILVGSGVLAVTVLGTLGLPVGPLGYASAVLGGLGLTLLLSSRVGRPGLLLPATIAVGVVTAGLLAAQTIGPVGRVGEFHRSYSSAAELPGVVELGAGDVELDLSALKLTEDRDLTISVGAGSVALQLPVGVASEVTYTIKAGEYNGSGVQRDGLDLTGVENVQMGSGGPVLRVRIDLDLGEVRVST